MSSVATESLLCPMCDYDLRGAAGQVEPRCPECGYRFDFAELRDPARRKHPYLFEHHPERNLRSFLQTLIGGLRPRRFWTLLHPGQPSRSARLLLYLLIIAATTLLPLAGQMGMLMYDTYQQRETARTVYARRAVMQPWRSEKIASAVNQLFPPLTTALLFELTLDRWETTEFIYSVVIPLAWLVLTIAALQVFQLSMRRARIRSIHMTRCVIYSGDVLVWFSLAMLVATGVYFVQCMRAAGNLRSFWPETYILCVLVACWFVFVWRLWNALRHYARFKHVIATILASQIVVGLTILVIMVWVVVQRRWYL